MPGEDWRRIQELFLAAADLPPDGQRLYLDSACAGDASLRGEVESLLASDQTAETGIATAVQSAAQSLLVLDGVPDADPLLGARLGPWRVEREIGHGGMGAVYLAVRDDEQFDQRAAIKLIKLGLDTNELLERFRRERQILATLDHPNIARLIDGGSTPDGRPYLVMEYVEGQSVSAWRREHNPSIEDCCHLFLQVCDAISHAHAKLVVHSDLKPANVLITASGAPKLLDFGVAKLLSPDAGNDLTLTVGAARPLTPEYASPEQVLGGPVTTATDVYSLGAVLYELLTGSRAHRITSASAAEVERAICETPIPRLSEAVDPALSSAARLRRRLGGDLENIVQMAMRKEPERRYASVEQLAADVRRYLEGRPVMARKDSLGYRAGKFLRRHRWGLLAGGLSVASLVTGTVLAISEARRADAARRVAEAQRAVAEQARQTAEREHSSAEQARSTAVSEARLARDEQQRAEQRLDELVGLANHSLFDIHSQIEMLPGATDARRKIVGTTLQYLEELEKDAAGDERLRMAVGAGYLKLAQVQGDPFGASLRDFPGALRSYRKAEDLVTPLYRAHPGDPRMLTTWIDIRLGAGRTMTASGKADEAVRVLTETLPAAQVLARLRPDDPPALESEVMVMGALARATNEHDARAALVWARKALAATTRLAERFPRDENIAQELSDAHSDVATYMTYLGELKEGLAEYELALPIRERLAAANPNDVNRRRTLMLAYAHVATLQGSPGQGNTGEFEAARKNYAKAVAIAERMAAADPKNRTAQYDLAAVLLRAGMIEVPPSGLAQSLELLRRAASISEALAQSSPDDARLRSDWEWAQEYIGDRLRAMGRLPEAAAAYRRSLDSAAAALAANPGDRIADSQAAASGCALAVALAEMGDRVAALAQAHENIERARANVSVASYRDQRQFYFAKTLLGLAKVHRVLAQSAESAAQSQAGWREALTAAESAHAQLDALPGASQNANWVPVAQDIQSLIAEARQHVR
jgi:tetratricopeptide (TPR) repeat protein